MHLYWMEPENYCSILKIAVSIHWFCDSWIQYLFKHTDKILLSTYNRSLNFACSTSLTWAENNCNLNWCSCREAKHAQFDCKDKLDLWFFYGTMHLLNHQDKLKHAKNKYQEHDTAWHTFRNVGTLYFSIFIDIIHCGSFREVQLSLYMLISSQATILLACISYNAI